MYPLCCCELGFTTSGSTSSCPKFATSGSTSSCRLFHHMQSFIYIYRKFSCLETCSFVKDVSGKWQFNNKKKILQHLSLAFIEEIVCFIIILSCLTFKHFMPLRSLKKHKYPFIFWGCIKNLEGFPLNIRLFLKEGMFIYALADTHAHTQNTSLY